MTGLTQEDIHQIIHVISQNPKIDEIVLFGSRAKGSHKPGSDIDLAFKGKALNLDDILEASIGLDDLNLPYKFDLILFERIQEQALVEHINRVGISLYKHPRLIIGD